MTEGTIFRLVSGEWYKVVEINGDKIWATDKYGGAHLLDKDEVEFLIEYWK